MGWTSRLTIPEPHRPMLIEIASRRNLDRAVLRLRQEFGARKTARHTVWLISLIFLAGCPSASDQPASSADGNSGQTNQADTDTTIANQLREADPAPSTEVDAPNAAQQSHVTDSVPVSIDWLASCQTDDDCADVTSCIEGYCFDAQLANIGCDRSHRACNAQLGLECDRFGVPTQVFRCDEGFVCEPDPLSERCTKRWCDPGRAYCESDQRRAVCNDEGTRYSSFPCEDGKTCESGACIDIVRDAEFRWCAESGAILWTSNLKRTRAQAEHCSTSARSRLDDLPTCTDGQCMNTGCAPGASRCVGEAREQRCSEDASWDPSTPCDSGDTCVAGQCRPATCTENDNAHCSAGHIARCISGQWDTEPCAFGCDGAGSATCREPECEPGAAACADDSTLAVCDSRATLSRVACPSNTRCFNTECVLHVCEPEERQCNGSVVEHCRPDGSGYDTEAVCNPHETCVDSSCRDRDQTLGWPTPLRVACGAQRTDRLSSQLSLRANFPLTCVVESLPPGATIQWVVLELDDQGELHDTDRVALTSEDETVVHVSSAEAGRYRLIAEVTRSDGSRTRSFADIEFQSMAPLIVRLSYESSLPTDSRQMDDTNLNLYLRTTNGSWISVENSVSNLNLTSSLGDAGTVTLERYSDRPSDLEYAVFSDEERSGDVEIGVQYWSGVFDVQPHILTYRGQQLIANIAGPILSSDKRHPNEMCVGPVWLVGTMNAATGRIRASQEVLPTFREPGLELCFESDEE